ncbi:hypothetical protein N7481_007800 [Penicillium waksmanii]|uniref:uncharacterized protein n=1 Tax=Penicillium waksmanii TaxID=69791 RepID=UPI0025476EDC|nr:uncharacterized protein N7481_007800 [Penicillium waksmanii]KAJ5980502.1 hypothetical protein N7481_007800 [Penicillium waksmanii]
MHSAAFMNENEKGRETRLSWKVNPGQAKQRKAKPSQHLRTRVQSQKSTLPWSLTRFRPMPQLNPVRTTRQG